MAAISKEARQEWITAYKQAHLQFSDIHSILAFLAKVTNPDCGQKLELDDSEYDGLHILFEYLAKQIAEACYENLPYPDLFAELCGNGGQGND